MSTTPLSMYAVHVYTSELHIQIAKYLEKNIFETIPLYALIQMKSYIMYQIISRLIFTVPVATIPVPELPSDYYPSPDTTIFCCYNKI